jgi:hypothetical protein
MTVGHQNLCEYAEDEWSLYKLWDDDLKKNMRRRQRCEVMGFLLLFGAPAIWQMGIPKLAIACASFGIMLVYGALKYMIDESNINYLMHQWDSNKAIQGFRRAAGR